MKNIIGQKIFDACDQDRFAKLSGDFNPLHTDPIRARREIFGEVVVHGVHAALYAVECFLTTWKGQRPQTLFLEHISGRFLDPIYLNKTVEIEQVSYQDNLASFQIWQGDQVCQKINMRWKMAPPHPCLSLSALSSTTIPQEHSFDQLAKHKGTVELTLALEHGRLQFPNTLQYLSPSQFANLLALTKIVGMECPGLYSVFLGLDITFHTNTPTSHIDFTVTRADKRFSSIQMTVKNESLSGTIDTRYRPAPVVQLDFEQLRPRVSNNKFSSQKALVIGGSRGLGEATAKLIVAGGGKVTITYHQGVRDAKRIATELNTQSNACDILHYTIAPPHPPDINLDGLTTPPTHIYFFASPKILPQRDNIYTSNLYMLFSHFYLNAFFELYQSYRRKWATEKVHIFYPSTAYLDQPKKGLTEYCAAKAAGETLCNHLTKTDPNLTITIERLPPLATDQTLSFMKNRVQNTCDTLLPIIKKMNLVSCSNSSDR